MAQSERFKEAVRDALGDLSISQAAYKTGVSYEYVRTMASYGRIPSEPILGRFAEGLGADLYKLRVAAGYEQPSDPVQRVQYALNGAPELSDVSKQMIVQFAKEVLEREKQKKEEDHKNNS